MSNILSSKMNRFNVSANKIVFNSPYNKET